MKMMEHFGIQEKAAPRWTRRAASQRWLSSKQVRHLETWPAPPPPLPPPSLPSAS
ncbi:Hypothetical predicted protein [Podarcis lilfordi]|uniref:Uncharacterized protein n=1 Tax=Podarcis lilfordi TaxID=74358 RepID=A0AA35KT05_9SAUR|nr:Hypothetical predicted protein [Podarcis lilfordi]